MTEQMAPSSEDNANMVTIPSDLAVSKATDFHASVLATLEGAKDAITVDLEGDEDPSICAIQMLIATKRTADVDSLEILFSDKAKAVLEAIDMP